MAEPLVVINTYRIKEDKVEGYRKASREWFSWNEPGHPRLLHHRVYLE